ncbi:hypothetical protein GCM10010274_65260 [Streptomyces lavendofoliae]|uniref:MD-2-related lipid-recognition domain-containing protein n=2 Tax=Streptomyces lavendofoliae TaxID=67314 RepID=A0A918I3V4_9ACTN|nr:hypothetical protein GCM10010274_65260 [Streptomyces lavendofoliae]
MLIKGTANEQIENGAYLKVTVKYGLIKLRNETCDLFKKLSDGAASQGNWTLALVQGDASKPIPKGEVQLVSTMKLTERTPKGEFTVSVSGYTVDDYSLLDLQFTFDNR